MLKKKKTPKKNPLNQIFLLLPKLMKPQGNQKLHYKSREAKIVPLKLFE